MGRFNFMPTPQYERVITPISGSMHDWGTKKKCLIKKRL